MHPSVARGIDQHCPSPPAFVPCVEDAAYTRQIGRHPAAFQRTLDAVSYEFLIAKSQLAESPSDTRDHASSAKMLSDNYAVLWEQRTLVPKAARREWFETVMVHLHALHKLEAGLLWLVDHVHAHGDLNAATAAGPSADNAMTITGKLLPASSPSAPTPATSSDPLRKQARGKKSELDTHPLWFLWQDAQRHLHHLTLRLRAWTPACGGAYAARDALRPSDLIRMDSSAFTWRVRQWVWVSCRVLTGPCAPLCVRHPVDCGVSGAELREGHTCLLAPSVPPFANEEPDLFCLLGALTSTAPDDVRIAKYVAGALLYRMLLETMLVRLRALPRCLFTWRLLCDALQRCASTCTSAAISSLDHDTKSKEDDAALLIAMSVYVDAIIVPYLAQRDCHLGNLGHTATETHSHFTQLSMQRMQALYTAALTASHKDQSAESAAHDSSAHTVLHFDSSGRPSEQQRTGMRVALGHALRRVCNYDAAASMPTAVMADILSNDDDDTPISLRGATQTTPELMSAVQREVAAKRLDERLFYSESRRTLQLDVFLHHYFTQSPTMAFDRLHQGTTANASSAAEEGGWASER
ncbi:hypothetical protein ABL78_2478 [Leptomonas seymouri]|uniref:Uncharacterized protein n=1 Tax=Leptomonas seymouri TaxID=5684 RepID=A0A0N1ILV8_LEPSE|nr:hypothetical protein ABL78_2478 [Leptomonas seymouri]|eukprot:KPI88413.1 hypothetical protein ABL78_2478 [Leptomonas seymouri]